MLPRVETRSVRSDGRVYLTLPAIHELVPALRALKDVSLDAAEQCSFIKTRRCLRATKSVGLDGKPYCKCHQQIADVLTIRLLMGR